MPGARGSATATTGGPILRENSEIPKFPCKLAEVPDSYTGVAPVLVRWRQRRDRRRLKVVTLLWDDSSLTELDGIEAAFERPECGGAARSLGVAGLLAELPS